MQKSGCGSLHLARNTGDHENCPWNNDFMALFNVEISLSGEWDLVQLFLQPFVMSETHDKYRARCYVRECRLIVSGGKAGNVPVL